MARSETLHAQIVTEKFVFFFHMGGDEARRKIVCEFVQPNEN